MSTTFSRGENPLKADKLNTAFSERVSRSGDTMTGLLTLAQNPTAAFDAATKQYVDTQVSSIVLHGGVLTFNTRDGDVVLNTTDVTTALGYIPYDAANPAGYRTASDITGALIPYAKIDSPTFTGDPRAPTPAPGDADTSIATTAFVYNALIPLTSNFVTSFNTRKGSVTLTLTDVTNVLGYTPYDNANPAGYQTYAQTVTTSQSVASTYVPLSQKAVALGVATLDASGKLLSSQLPATATGTLSYKGGWNAATNTPTATSGAQMGGVVQPNGSYYVVTVSGTTAAIDGNTTWVAGDWIASTGTVWQRVQNSTSPYLPLTGGTLSGALVLAADPAAPLQAATRQYADTKLALAGGTLTGSLVLAADPTINLHAATKQYVDGHITTAVGNYLPLSGGTLTGSLTLSADPISPLHATTKQYTDNKVSTAIAALGTMAVQNANAVAITGGTASLTNMTILGNAGSFLLYPTDPRNPFTPAKLWTDATGNAGAYILADGSWQLPTVAIKALTATTATIPTLTSTSLTVSSFTASGGNSVFDTIGIKNTATLLGDARNPTVAIGWADATGVIGPYIQTDGTFRLGGVSMVAATAASMTVTGALTAGSFSPISLAFGTASLSPSDRRNRYAAAWTDGTDQGALVLTGTGSLAFAPASGVLAKHLQATIERSHMMSQGPPSHSDSANTAGVSGTTYHLTATLDSAGYDAVRLVIISMRTTDNAVLTGCIATSANVTDPINPKDAAGNPVEWRSVTWGSNGAPTNWEDQPEGTLRLVMNTVATLGSTVLSFANTTGVTVGMIASIPQYNTATGFYLANHWAVVTAVTPTTVTISKPIQNIDTPSSWPVFFTTNQFTMPAWGGAASGVMGNLYVSDWVPLSSLDRSDGGRWPILMARVYANGNHTTLVTDLSQTNWNGAVRDRLWNCYTQVGDFVTNPTTGFTATTDNGIMIVGWVQYYSRSRGCSVLFAGDSITQGIGGTIPGLGALQLAAYQLSTPSCPVTNFGMVNGWNNAGVGQYPWTTVLQHMDVFQPNVLAMCAWTRNGEFSKPPTGKPAYAQESADWYWQQSLRIATKARRKYRTQTIFYPMGPSDAAEMTATTEAVRYSAVTRSKQANLSGVMYLDSDALIGTGSTPVNDSLYPGLHPPQSAQMLLSLDVVRQYKSALGIV